MPRYLIQRPFSEGLDIPINEQGVKECLLDEVTWIHSYVSEDKKQTFCIYDAPSPEAVRKASRRNNLPVALIIEVRVLDPYFYL
jgi:hypothetical protein